MTSTAQSAANMPSAPASYLILQGLASPFFNILAKQLSSDGSSVHRVNFCGGDWWYGGHAHNHRFNGKLTQMEAYYRHLIKRHGITSILLFGDCRPIHKIARAVAAEAKLPVWVFEEGYRRPGFITCEYNGTNDLSSLPRSREAIKKRAEQLGDSEGESLNAPDLPNPMPPRVRMDFTHHMWNILLKPLYFRFMTHRPNKMSAEIKGWLARLKRKLKYKNINTALIKRFENPGAPFFMAPLQLNSDFQIREHSDYEGVLDFIRETVKSFSLNAPKNCILMFKGHPLDNGMIDYRSYIAIAALNHGVDGRVDYIEGGDLDLFLKHTEGVVLINSTVGYAALIKAKPIKAMGRALYNMQGLTHQKSLDTFWKKPSSPNLSLIGEFLKVVHNDSQIAGDFFTPQGIEMAAIGAASRIKSDTTLIKDAVRSQRPSKAQLEEISA